MNRQQTKPERVVRSYNAGQWQRYRKRCGSIELHYPSILKSELLNFVSGDIIGSFLFSDTTSGKGGRSLVYITGKLTK